jgi:ATP-dependent protease HslVU (ClpYQ) peptidase subunit
MSIGIVIRDDGRIIIGADGQTTIDKYYKEHNSKIMHYNEYVIIDAGYVVEGKEILKLVFERCNDEYDEYEVDDYNLEELFQKAYRDFKKTNDGLIQVEYSNEYLIVNKETRKIFYYSLYELKEITADYYCIGSGKPIAIGAIEGIYKYMCDKNKLNGISIIRIAIEVCINNIISCGMGIDIIEI